MNFNDVAIVSVKGSDYRIHFWYISENDAIAIMKYSDLNEKVDYHKVFYCVNIRRKWVPIIKKIEKNY